MPREEVWCMCELESMLPDILSKKESMKKSETERCLFFCCFSAPFYKASVLLHLLKPWHTCLRHSHFLPLWWIITLYSCFSLLDPALAAQVTYYFSSVLIWLLVLFLLLFLLQLLEKLGKMSTLQKHHRCSSPVVVSIHYVWLFWIYFPEILKLFCVFCLPMQTETYMQILCSPVASVSPPSSGKTNFFITYTSPFT